MDQVIEDRKMRKERIMRSIGASTSFMGQCCSNCCDENDDIHTRRDGRDAGQVLLRPHLKERLEELQLALDEKTTELNNLKHELGVQTDALNVKAAAHDASTHVSKKEAREAILRHYAHMFAKTDTKGALMKTTFLSWKTYVENGKTKDKAMKHAALGFTLLMTNGSLALAFSSWRDLTRKDKEKKDKKNERMMTY